MHDAPIGETRPPPELAKRAIWGWWARVARPVGGIILLVCAHCGDSSECPAGFECAPIGGGGSGAAGTGGGGQSSGGGGSGGDGGAGGGVPAGCDLVEGEAVGADCGVFVKAESTGDGSQGNPYGSIQDAVDNIKTFKRIYVCGADTFNGSVELPGGISILGSLACDGWKFSESNAKPHIVGEPDVPALNISGAGSTRVDHIDIESPNAVANGASSVAVMVTTTTTTFDHCALSAGDGAKGEAGAAYTAVAQSGGMGQAGAEGCLTGTPTLGGAAGINPVCGDQSGGSGGNGQNTGSGGPGGPGDPNMNGGIAGTGQGAGACIQGGQGDSGGPGNPGSAGTGIGQLEGGTYTPAPAPASGTPGDPGYGGGGGGGAHRCELTPIAGPSGGGGGAGGCGGGVGRGGLGGGASFALAVINADVTLVDSALGAGIGGEGGDGGNGQTGGAGGEGGPKGPIDIASSNSLGADACAGGKGGAGGRGGAGGGGAGGPAAAIARAGGSITSQGNVNLNPGSASGGGAGADNFGEGTAGPEGDPGTSCKDLVFDGSSSGQCNNG